MEVEKDAPIQDKEEARTLALIIALLQQQSAILGRPAAGQMWPMNWKEELGQLLVVLEV